jgi:UDP-N-acetyl-D-galactosamine dehydrogenase
MQVQANSVNLNTRIAVIGLGYVGLPLAMAFGRKYATVGFDSSERLVTLCQQHRDPHGDLADGDFEQARRLTFSNEAQSIRDADIIIIAVPTPVDIAHSPDFGPLISASREAGEYMKRGAVVVYESTVYPGATEEVCIPELERASGMRWLQDFNVGYSPERINPGDKEHTLATVVKIVSGDTPATLDRVADLYDSVLIKGVYRASSIKVAEAAKVIENTQRDLNIGLMNEFALLFHRLGIDTVEVLEAAGSKWNFLPFRPGLVGGHCIGVDPYYLTYKAETVGYFPEVILAARRINDHMGKYVAEQTLKNISLMGACLKGAKVIVLGLTFKEDCPDLRNSRVVDIIAELKSYGVEVFVHDPVTDPDLAMEEYGVQLLPWDQLPQAQAMVAAVAHRPFLARPLVEYQGKLVRDGIFMDVKSRFDAPRLRELGLTVWRL